MLISVVAPVYNESASIKEFLGRLQTVTAAASGDYQWEFMLVDDGSRDNSLSLAKEFLAVEPRLRVVELRRNFGQTAALQAGLSAARGDIVISMDSDLQHFPEDIPLFLAEIEKGFDLVCGWRHDRKEGAIRRWPSRVANLMIRRVSQIEVHDFGTTFRAYRADLVQHIQLLGEQHRFVPALAALVGAKVTEVKIQNVERPFGQSNYGIGRTFSVFLDIIFLYFLTYYFTRPLKAFGKVALALMAVGVSISSSLVVYSWVTGIPTVRDHGGWFLLSALLLLGSLQVLLTGVLAEILVRVYYRSSHTDAHFVRREWNQQTRGEVQARLARRN